MKLEYREDFEEAWYEMRRAIISHRLCHPSTDEEVVEAFQKLDTIAQQLGIID